MCNSSKMRLTCYSSLACACDSRVSSYNIKKIKIAHCDSTEKFYQCSTKLHVSILLRQRMQGINSVKNFEWIIKSCTVSLLISFAVPITMQQIMRGVRMQYIRQITVSIPCGILGHVWYLIVSFPDLLPSFLLS